MKGKRRGIDFIIISFSTSQQLYPLRGEVSGSVPKLQTCTASERTFLIYSSSLRGEVSESVPRIPSYTA